MTDNVLGHIPNEHFRLLSSEYNEEQAELRNRLPKLEERLEQLRNSLTDVARIDRAAAPIPAPPHKQKSRADSRNCPLHHRDLYPVHFCPYDTRLIMTGCLFLPRTGYLLQFKNCSYG